MDFPRRRFQTPFRPEPGKKNQIRLASSSWLLLPMLLLDHCCHLLTPSSSGEMEAREGAEKARTNSA